MAYSNLELYNKWRCVGSRLHVQSEWEFKKALRDKATKLTSLCSSAEFGYMYIRIYNKGGCKGSYWVEGEAEDS